MMLMLPRSLEQAARAVSPASARACARPSMHLGMNCRMAHLATSHRMGFFGRSLHPVLGQILPQAQGPNQRGLGLVLGDSSSLQRARSRLALPAPLFVRLPIGHLE